MEQQNEVATAGQSTEASKVASSESASVAVADYAGFWIRFAATMIDAVIFAIVQSILEIFLGTGVIAQIIYTVLMWVYAVYMIVTYQATLGKMALGLRVERTNGDRVTYKRAILREVVGKTVSAIVIFIGYIMVAFTAKKQGLHDMIADTVVIRVKK